MAWVLVRLKVALLRAGLRTAGVQGTLGAIFALVLALIVGGLAGALFLAVRLLHGRDATDATAAGFALVFFAWVLGPVVAAGAEGTLEPHKLSLFPLTSRQLLPGLLLAALVGFGGLATVLILLGAIAGMAPASPLIVVTVAAGASHLFLCAACSRLLSTAISGAARSRRWRDVALVVGPALALSINVGFQFVSRSFSDGPPQVGAADSGALGIARTVVRFVPSGPAALAMGYAREGRTLLALAALTAAVAIVLVAVIAWGRVLQRVLTSAPVAGSLAAGRSARDLRPKWAPFLPGGRVGAVAAKELRLTWRDPRQRVATFSAVFAGAIPLVSFRLLSIGSGRIALLAAIPAFLFGSTACNQFGFDGPAHWTNVAAGRAPRADLLGKNIARAVVAAPVVVLVVVLLSVRASSVEYVIAALALAVAAFGVTLGLGNLTSAAAPVALPDNPTNVFSSGNTGQGLAATGPALGVLLAGLVLVAPIAVALALVGSPLLRAVLCVAAVAYGVAGWQFGWRRAAARIEAKEPEFLAKLSDRL